MSEDAPEADRYTPPYPGPGWWAYQDARDKLLPPKPTQENP